MYTMYLAQAAQGHPYLIFRVLKINNISTHKMLVKEKWVNFVAIYETNIKVYVVSCSQILPI